MVDYRKLLDAVVGALAKPAGDDGSRPSSQAPARGGLEGIGATSVEGVLQKAKDLVAQHPTLTQAALLGLAGLMLGRRRKGGFSGGLAKLGGLAVIGGLAYGAYRGRNVVAPALRKVESLTGMGTGGAGTGEEAVPPATSRFHPASQTEDDIQLYLRAMVAAAASDGTIDGVERARIARGLNEAGIDPESTRWLEREMESPASVDELADGAGDPEIAAQVYAAALLAIDPDTLQEHEFLRQLAEALDLDKELRGEIEETIAAVR